MIEALIVRKEQMTANRWSGGTTTQIDLFPACSTYGGRDFAFRVSSAVIEESPSRFTALPDYQRWIAMLSGPVVLEHAPQTQDGTLKVELAPLQVHAFDGGTPTTSFGEATDFNLMLRKGLFGKMAHVSAEQLAAPAGPSWIEAWLSERRPDAKGHLAVFFPEALSEKVTGSVSAAEVVVFEEDVKNVIRLERGDYVRLSGAVRALRGTALVLSEGCDLLLLYMET
ncbi:HutD family protein [Acidaminobacter hydrogenoformans]|uniref:Various environmental stresses-induced protein Ves n=1 Tax=Acidaminobacter hydrogenoformans DSM 2784 TaxID=1120920 RepID=A0A1G5RWM5_9FIRM|nr:HutD family protein [Acidaminobacter hydrogenoformans]SCZ77709.1 Various environmental stresses-induced protein Ves [Acidaminobacter hydrogenoformans DSM 2784]